MSEIFFVNITLDLARPMRVINSKGERKEETLRRFAVSLPVRDKERAEQMMDYLAQQFAQVFAEVEKHVNAEREDIKAGSRNTGGEARPGDELQIAVAPSTEIAGPFRESGVDMGRNIPQGIDGSGGDGVPREEKKRVE